MDRAYNILYMGESTQPASYPKSARLTIFGMKQKDWIFELTFIFCWP
jgi:hypothetical protein